MTVSGEHGWLGAAFPLGSMWACFKACEVDTVCEVLCFLLAQTSSIFTRSFCFYDQQTFSMTYQSLQNEV